MTMAKQLPPAREQLDRIEDGLDRLLQFTGGDVSPTVLNSTINQIERLEKQCQNENWAITALLPPKHNSTALLPPKPDSTTLPSYMLAERALAWQASHETARDSEALKICEFWKRW